MDRKHFLIACCPNFDCGSMFLFSCDPKDKIHIASQIADESHNGKSMMSVYYKMFC